MFINVIGMSVSLPFENFEDCLRDFLNAVKEQIEDGTINLQMLETTCWIEEDEKFIGAFYDMRDKGYEMGIMKDGQVVNK